MGANFGSMVGKVYYLGERFRARYMGAHGKWRHCCITKKFQENLLTAAKVGAINTAPMFYIAMPFMCNLYIG